jgi:hypothetical protein
MVSLAAAAGCAVLTGCSTPTHVESDANWEHFRQAMAATEKMPVIPPAYNPYSTVSPETAKAYIDLYYEGYRVGLAGYYLTPVFKDQSISTAKKDGYEAGVLAGLKEAGVTNCASGMYHVK